jgi:hypothetical protein
LLNDIHKSISDGASQVRLDKKIFFVPFVFFVVFVRNLL